MRAFTRLTSLALVSGFIAAAEVSGSGQGPGGTAVEPPGRFSFGEPGISADGREIAFTSGGDIWSVPASGGEARLLVAHEATERRPLFSPDGASLAFVSTRTGGGDIYVLTLASGVLQRI